MLPASTIQRTSPFSAGDRLFLGLLTALGLAVGARGILHYGYIGQDFMVHLRLIRAFPKVPWSILYVQSNPPGLYGLGSLIRTHVAPDHFLEALALVFVVANAAGLWVFYDLIWNGIANWQLRYSAAAFATLVPFRMIHSVVLASDALTLPLFALATLFTVRLFRNPASLGAWVGLSLCLSAGMFSKYAFSGLLPAATAVLALALARHLPARRRLRWAVVGFLALAVPTEAFLLEMVESSRVNGTITDLVWLKKGEPPIMRWRDVLLPKRSDLALLSAPEYFRDKIYAVRRYSYPALLHVASVTDVMNLFQAPPARIPADWAHRVEEPFLRERSARSQVLQRWSVRWSLVYSGLALAGTLYFAWRCAQSLARRAELLADSTAVVLALAVGFYSPIFASLTRLNDTYEGGFWLPRLVLPAILTFYCLGFAALDSLCQWVARLRRTPRVFLNVFAGYTLVACGLFVGFLW